MAGSSVLTCSDAVSPSRVMVTVRPSTDSEPAKVAWLTPSRSATIEGTTDISASVDDIPASTRSKPRCSSAFASTSEVARASEPWMASSMTCTPRSPPMASALSNPSFASGGPTVR